MCLFTDLENLFETLQELLFKESENPDPLARLRANWSGFSDSNLLCLNLQGLPCEAQLWVNRNKDYLREKFLFSQINFVLSQKTVPKVKTFHFQGPFDVVAQIHPHPQSTKILEAYFAIHEYEKDLERLRGALTYQMEYAMLKSEYELLCRILELPVFL